MRQQKRAVEAVAAVEAIQAELAVIQRKNRELSDSISQAEHTQTKQQLNAAAEAELQAFRKELASGRERAVEVELSLDRARTTAEVEVDELNRLQAQLAQASDGAAARTTTLDPHIQREGRAATMAIKVAAASALAAQTATAAAAEADAAALGATRAARSALSRELHSTAALAQAVNTRQSDVASTDAAKLANAAHSLKESIEAVRAGDQAARQRAAIRQQTKEKRRRANFNTLLQQGENPYEVWRRAEVAHGMQQAATQHAKRLDEAKLRISTQVAEEDAIALGRDAQPWVADEALAKEQALARAAHERGAPARTIAGKTWAGTSMVDPSGRDPAWLPSQKTSIVPTGVGAGQVGRRRPELLHMLAASMSAGGAQPSLQHVPKVAEDDFLKPATFGLDLNLRTTSQPAPKLAQRELTKLEKSVQAAARERQRANISAPMKVMGKLFEGAGWEARPAAIEFPDFSVGAPQTVVITLTNISPSFNSYRVNALPDEVRDAFEVVWRPPGRVSAGTATKVTITFTPHTLQPIVTELPIITATGGMTIPVRATPKQALPQLNTSTLHLPAAAMAEQCSASLVLSNAGMVPCAWTARVADPVDLPMDDMDSSAGGRQGLESKSASSLPSGDALAATDDAWWDKYGVPSGLLCTGHTGSPTPQQSAAMAALHGWATPSTEGVLTGRGQDRLTFHFTAPPTVCQVAQEAVEGSYAVLIRLDFQLTGADAVAPAHARPEVPSPLLALVQVQVVRPPVYARQQHVYLGVCPAGKQYRTTLRFDNRGTIARKVGVTLSSEQASAQAALTASADGELLRMGSESDLASRPCASCVPSIGYVQLAEAHAQAAGGDAGFPVVLSVVPPEPSHRKMPAQLADVQSMGMAPAALLQAEVDLLAEGVPRAAAGAHGGLADWGDLPPTPQGCCRMVVPVTLRAAGQKLPVITKVYLDVTLPRLRVSTDHMLFQPCPAQQARLDTLVVWNPTALIVKTGMTDLPPWLQLVEGEGFATLLPNEVIPFHMLFRPASSATLNATCRLLSTLGTSHKLAVSGRGIPCGIQLTTSRLLLPATPAHHNSSACVQVRNVHHTELQVSVVPPEQASGVLVTPRECVLPPGGAAEFRVTYTPVWRAPVTLAASAQVHTSAELTDAAPPLTQTRDSMLPLALGVAGPDEHSAPSVHAVHHLAFTASTVSAISRGTVHSEAMLAVHTVGLAEGPTVEPAAVQFGSVAVGSVALRSIRMTNPWPMAVPLRITGAMPHDAVQILDVPPTIPAQSAVTVQLKFSPDVAGSYLSPLRIHAGTASAVHMPLPVSGEGDGPSLALTLQPPGAAAWARSVLGTGAYVEAALATPGTAVITAPVDQAGGGDGRTAAAHVDFGVVQAGHVHCIPVLVRNTSNFTVQYSIAKRQAAEALAQGTKFSALPSEAELAPGQTIQVLLVLEAVVPSKGLVSCDFLLELPRQPGATLRWRAEAAVVSSGAWVIGLPYDASGVLRQTAAAPAVLACREAVQRLPLRVGQCCVVGVVNSGNQLDAASTAMVHEAERQIAALQQAKSMLCSDNVAPVRAAVEAAAAGAAAAPGAKAGKGSQGKKPASKKGGRDSAASIQSAESGPDAPGLLQLLPADVLPLASPALHTTEVKVPAAAAGAPVRLGGNTLKLVAGNVVALQAQALGERAAHQDSGSVQVDGMGVARVLQRASVQATLGLASEGEPAWEMPVSLSTALALL